MKVGFVEQRWISKRKAISNIGNKFYNIESMTDTVNILEKD